MRDFVFDDQKILRSRFLTKGANALTVEVLDHGYFFGDERWNQYGVISPFARLYFITKDSGWIECGDRRVDLNPGRMYLIPPFLKINLRTEFKIEKFYLHINCHYGGLDLLEGMRFLGELKLDEKILNGLLRAIDGDTLYDLFEFKSLLYHITAMFAEAFLPKLHERVIVAEKYKDVHKYVNDNLDFSLNYRDVADKLNYSPDVLRTKYRRDTGQTLAGYIQSRLIQKAAVKLISGNESIKCIASELGFNDEFYFSRFFKKKMNYSPKKYRQLNSGDGRKKYGQFV